MVDAQCFRDAMARLGAAVTVVTTDGSAGRYGLTVSAVCSVTDAPPSLLVCVNRQSRSHAKLTENGVLCVNVLASAQQDLCGRFAGKALADEDRFAAAEWSTLRTGSPVLAGALAAFDCRIVLGRFIGTHSAFLCEVDAIAISEADAGLVYFDRSFHHLRLTPPAVVGP